METTDDWTNLPLNEKIIHKNWKARVSAFDALEKQLTKMDSPQDLLTYIDILKRVPLDNNISVHEKGLETIDKALKLFPSITKLISKDLISNIIQKSFSAKPKIKQLSFEIILQIIENEDQDNALEFLKAGLVAKQPKIAAATVDIYSISLKDFGVKVISPKVFFEPAVKLLDHSDKGVRDSVKSLLLECYKYLKDGLKPLIKDIKPVILKELEVEFQTIASEKPKITRFLQSQAPSSEKTYEIEGPHDETAVEQEAEAFDAFDLAEPVDISSKIPPDFQTEIIEKKWQIRKEALENLEKILDVPKIIPKDFSPIIDPIKKIVTSDSNVNVVAAAIKCLEKLSLGLRKSFGNTTQIFFPFILEKTKEKRGAIVEVTKNCLDAFFGCIESETYISLCCQGFKNKVPTIKEESARLVEKAILKLKAKDFSLSLTKNLCNELIKILEDSSQNVRDAAFHTMAVLITIVGEKKAMAYLDCIDEIKKTRLKETVASLLLTNQSQPPSTKTENAKASKQPINSLESKQSQPVTQSEIVATELKPDALVKKPSFAQLGPVSTTPSSKNVNTFEQDKNDPTDPEASESVALIACSDLIGQENTDFLSSLAWKERLTAFEQLFEKLHALGIEGPPPMLSFRLICLKSGFKDTNFQVLKIRFQILSLLTCIHRPFPLRIVHDSVPHLVDKFSDVKLRDRVFITLSDLCEASSLNYVVYRIVLACENTKNIKNQIGCYQYLESSIKEFGLNLDLKYLIPFVKKGLEATSPDLKKVSTTLVLTLYLYMGPKLRSLLDDVKPALLSVIDGELDQLKGQKPAPPSRVFLYKDSHCIDVEQEIADDNNSSYQPEIILEDLITRVDISGQLTDEIFNEMNDKNWKLRNQALETVQQIIQTSKHITQNVGSLPSNLTARFGDNNKNLIILALNVAKDLILSMGKFAANLKQVMIPRVLFTLSDGKIGIRQAAIAVLSAWSETVDLNSLFDGEESVICSALKTNNSTMRLEINTWLIQQLSIHNISKKNLSNSLLAILNCISDRNAETRKSTQNLISIIIPLVGLDLVQKLVNNLDNVSQNNLKTVLETASVNSNDAKRKQKKQSDETAPLKESLTSKKAKSDVSEVLSLKDIKETTKSSQEISEESVINYKPGSQLQRIKEMSSFRFSAPSKEYWSFLSNNFSSILSESLYSDLFHSDFKKQAFALQFILNLMEKSSKNDMKTIFECSDLILGYCATRIFDSNPVVLTKSLEVTEKILSQMHSSGKILLNEELDMVVPAIISRFGDTKESIRKSCQSIIQVCSLLCPVQQLLNFLMSGFESKASKIRFESLKATCLIVENQSIKLDSLPNIFKLSSEIAKLLNDKDSSTRKASLDYFSLFYAQVGEKVYDYTGKIESKSASYLKERFKRLPKPDLNKTFNLSSADSMLTDRSNNESLISNAENISNIEDASCIESTAETLFDINEFLKSNGVVLHDVKFDPVPATPEFDPMYKYTPPLILNIQDISRLHLPFVIELSQNLKNKTIDDGILKSAVDSLPLIFEMCLLSSDTIEAMDYIVNAILDYSFGTFENFRTITKPYFINSFKILNFIFHSSSYLHFVTSETIQVIYKNCLQLYDTLNTDCQDVSFDQLISAHKSLVCLIAELVPFHVITRALILLASVPDTYKNQQKINIINYSLRILIRRLNDKQTPIFCDFTSLLSTFNDPSTKKLYPIRPLKCDENYMNSKLLLDGILILFLTYLYNLQIIQDLNTLENQYPIIHKRITFLQYNMPRCIPLPPLQAVFDDLIDKAIELRQRIPISIKLLHLCIEHGYDLFHSEKFKSLSSELKFFLRISFTLLRNKRIDSVFYLFEPVLASFSPREALSSHFENAKSFSSHIDKLLEQKQTQNVNISTPPSSQGMPETIVELVEQSSIKEPNVDIDQTKKTPKNIEDLRRRFENIKKGYIK